MGVHSLRGLIRSVILERTANLAFNVGQLQTLQAGHGTIAQMLDVGQEELERLASIPPLTNARIVDVAGSGSSGMAFVLDNDHVLKIFSHSGVGPSIKDYAA